MTASCISAVHQLYRDKNRRALMARIYVIEDDEDVRGQLCVLLRRGGYEAIYAESFEDVAQQVFAADPDLVLLDLGLPGTDGQYIIKELRQSSDVPIIVLTSRAGDLDELMSISLGVDDFIAKPKSGQLLLAHIDAVLRRMKGLGAAGRILEKDGLVMDVARSTASYQGSSVELTKNESRILELLLSRSGQIVSREEIMEALWNSDAFVDDNTLTVNMNRLRQALTKIGITHCVVTHRGQGYSL
jgi:DNA-binding response OmpR family regulator